MLKASFPPKLEDPSLCFGMTICFGMKIHVFCHPEANQEICTNAFVIHLHGNLFAKMSGKQTKHG